MDIDTSIDNPDIDWSFLYFQPIRFETVPDIGPVLPEGEDLSAPPEMITEPPPIEAVMPDIPDSITWLTNGDLMVI